MWGSSPIKAERTKRLELVPKETILATMTLSIPAGDKVWLINEAYRRQVPVSWLATEILKLGMETYTLMGPPEIEAVPITKREVATKPDNEPRLPWDGAGGNRRIPGRKRIT